MKRYRFRSERVAKTLSKTAFAVVAVVAVSLPAAWAQEYPTKSVRVVIPFSPGGSTDSIGRIVADELSKSLGQPVVAENVTGGGGSIGTAHVAAADPDGYTLLLANSGAMISNALTNPDAGYDSRTDFSFASLVARYPNYLLVRSDSGIDSLDELIDKAKAEPGRVTFGSSGVNSNTHLLGEMLKIEADIDMLHVPYRGGGAVLTALLGGEIVTYWASLSSALPHIQSGALKAIAVTAEARSEHLPEVPTVAEAGYPKLLSYTWLGIAAPAGTPLEIRQLLAENICDIVRKEDAAAQMQKFGTEPMCNTPEAFQTYVEAEWGAMEELLKAIQP